MFLGLQLTEGALIFLQLTLQPWHFPLSQQLLLLLHTQSKKSMRTSREDQCVFEVQQLHTTQQTRTAGNQVFISSFTVGVLYFSFCVFVLVWKSIFKFLIQPRIFSDSFLKCSILNNLRRLSLLQLLAQKVEQNMFIKLTVRFVHACNNLPEFEGDYAQYN